MRQAKHILLIDSSENRRGARCFTLRVRGFRVTCASCPEEAAPLLAELQYDLVIGVWPIGASFASLAHRASTPSLLICERVTGPPPNLVVDAVLLAPLCTSAHILERAKVMCARKRGPRPKKLPAIDTPQLREAAIA
jgi:hypothetical protein